MIPPNQRTVQNQISGQGSESPNKNYAKMEQAVLSSWIQAC